MFFKGKDLYKAKVMPKKKFLRWKKEIELETQKRLNINK